MLEKVKLNEGLERIGRFSFQDCESLREILIPSTVKELGDGIFNFSLSRILRGNYGTTRKNNPKLVIYCYAGTPALEYARAAGYPIENAAKLKL